MDHSFYEDVADGEPRSVLRFNSGVAPVEVAVLPLMDRDVLAKPAREILDGLRSRGIRVDDDTSGSIGRRYRRNDEVGTPYCVTVDYETLEQGTVTIRDRDSMKQVKLDLKKLFVVLEELLAGERSFVDAGVPVAAAAPKEQLTE